MRRKMSPNMPKKTDNRNTIANVSVVKKLRKRELHGTLKRRNFGTSGSSKFFHSKIPSRLAYPLRDLVKNEVVFSQEPHVFLGFSSNGVFVISYTKVCDSHFATNLPVHGETYHLHWWLFNAHNKMKKVKSLKLFENEEITGNDLVLHYVEWPSEEAKIVVYGVVSYMNTAYITVASTPPTSKCQDCLPLEDGCDDNLCIKHGFSAHLKYCLDGPTKNYNILHGFNINNLIIINMGYCISVTSVGYLPKDKSTAFLPLSSIKRAGDEKNTVHSAKRVLDDDLMNPDLLVFHPELINRSNFALPVDELISSGTSSQTESEISTAKDTDSSSMHSWSSATPTEDNSENSVISIQRFCSCRPDTLETPSNNHDPYMDLEHKTIVLRTPICGRRVKTDLTSNENLSYNSNFSDKCVQHANALPSNFDPYAMPLSPINNQNTVTTSSKLCKKICNEEKPKAKLIVPVKQCGFCGLECRKKSFKNKNMLDEELQNSQLLKSGKHFQKPKAKSLKFSSSSGMNKNETFAEYLMGTPSPSASESGSSVYCLGSLTSKNDASFSDKIVSFTETIYGPTRMPFEQESSDSTNYIDPATLIGANNLPLHTLNSGSHRHGTAFSQNLVLDIEHLIFDVLRTRCYKTYKFGYLIDYVAQIIDTCANTYSVIIVIEAILSLSSMKENATSLKGNTGGRRNLSFLVFLSWQLQTGRYEVIGASPLIDCAKDNTKVDPESFIKPLQLLSQRKTIPKRYMQGRSSVYVLNNIPVLKEKSLDMLWDADHIIALKL